MRLYDENEAEMCNALAADLRKSKQESMVNEVDFLKNDLRNVIMHLRQWAAPEKVIYFAHTICTNLLRTKIVVLRFYFSY